MVYKLNSENSPFLSPKKTNSNLSDVKTSVIEYYRELSNDYSPNQVIIGPGYKELFFLLQLAFTGRVIIPTPCWKGYFPQIQLANNKTLFVDTTEKTGWKLTADHLDQTLSDNSGQRQQMLLLSSPNCVGVTYTRKELKELSMVCKKHNVIIVSNEIHLETQFKGLKSSISKYNPDHTIILTDTIKWSGHNLGALIFGKELNPLKEGVISLSQTILTNKSTFNLDFNPAKDYRLMCNKIYQRLIQYATTAVENISVNYTNTVNGYFLYINLDNPPRDIESHHLVKFLANEYNLIVTPGSDLCSDEFSIRISLTNFDGNAALAAARRGQSINNRFINRWCKPTLEAIDILREAIPEFYLRFK